MKIQKSHFDKKAKTALLFLSVGFCLFFLVSCTMMEFRDPEGEVETVDLTISPDDPSTPVENIYFPYSEGLDDYFIHEEAQSWADNYELLHGYRTSKELIMSVSDIDNRNMNVINECHTLWDMSAYPPNISGQDVRTLILSYSIPYGNKFDTDGNQITQDILSSIDSNRNVDEIPETVDVKYAVVTQRTDLKNIPTDLGLFNSGDKYYNLTQETEIVIGTPVAVLHTSSDADYVFIQAYNYYGWIRRDHVAFASREKYSDYFTEGNYVTVVKKHIFSNDVRVDMGVRLPYVSEDQTDYTVLLPSGDENGDLCFVESKISKADSVFGSLPYTMLNFYNQAFEFLDVEYGWGGADGGVDCSGYVVSVFRTFGFVLPRNTGELRDYFGNSSNIYGLNAETADSLMKNLKHPAAIHSSGHIMLYLGKKDGLHYVIHAPSGGEKVNVTSISIPGNLISVSELGSEN
ncbi:MAG: hypothetical protein E7672_04275 [Ruminococcaceae bacterium]|nr:hypothetical protein [Oscillospiraceae bacterium]